MEETETEGCPLSYLRFGIVAHPILVILQSMARDRELEGLSLRSGKSCIAQALANDHLMFLGALRENIMNAMQ